MWCCAVCSLQLIQTIFSGALARVESSALCENCSFISQKANVSKVATVTVTAAAVMLDPTCPPKMKERQTEVAEELTSYSTADDDKAKPGPSGKLENTHGSVCYSYQLPACDSI